MERLPDLLACWFLTGPTASGKTGVGIELALRLQAEIISMDSMALYREMDIGTAKPSAADRARVAHHLIDVIGPGEEFSVAQYLDAARAKVHEIRDRGHQVLFVGGTPLYLKALLRGMFEGPPADWSFRRQVEDEVRRVGQEALHQRLWQVDPLAAARLHPHDMRRIVRALEVYKLTGRPLSHQQIHFEEGLPAERCRVFALGWPRAELHRRIEQRVEAMFAAGLREEVQGLLRRHQHLGRTAAQAVGYREVIAHLEGRYDYERTIALVKSRTRQFARRQETWFRSLSECRRVEQSEGVLPAEAAARIRQLGEGHTPESPEDG